jgi:hypothetical protein
MILPTLRHAGLDVVGDSFVRWHDELLRAAGVDEQLGIRGPLRPDPGLEESAAGMLTKDPPSSLLLADSRSVWVLDFWAAMMPQAQFLLFYNTAETALAHALVLGVDPRLFLDGWQAACGQMLRFQRRYRRRALLLDAAAAAAQTSSLVDVCGRLGLMLQTPSSRSVAESALPAIERLVARSLAAAEPAVHLLQAELDASAQPLGDVPSPVQSQEIYNNYLQWRHQLDQAGKKLQASEQALKQLYSEQQTHAQLAQETFARQLLATTTETRKENEMLLLQLHQLQEKIEANVLNKQQLEQEQQAHVTQQNKLQKQVAQLTRARDEQSKLAAERLIELDKARQAEQSLTAMHAESVQENELLLLQLHQIQEELESIFLQKQQAERELHRVKAITDREIEEQRQLVASLKQTVSWKITAPVRAVARSFKRSNKGRQKTRKQIRKEVRLLKESGLFDETWYRAEYTDVAGKSVDPVEHYLCHGAAEGRNPSPLFNALGYLETNRDVAKTGMNPLVHYVKFGKTEGRKGFEPGKR